MSFRALVLLVLLPTAAAAQTPSPSPAPAPPRQTDADEYTRYELLAPGTGRFRILYEVTATTPGAVLYYNPIRKGSLATEERVRDRLTGRLLDFSIVGGREAKAGGLAEADADERYIAVALPRPVPAGDGEVRLLIEKTYQDPEELPGGRGGHRLHAHARHPAQRGGAARRLRARGLQRPRPGPDGGGRARAW